LVVAVPAAGNGSGHVAGLPCGVRVRLRPFPRTQW